MKACPFAIFVFVTAPLRGTESFLPCSLTQRRPSPDAFHLPRPTRPSARGGSASASDSADGSNTSDDIATEEKPSNPITSPEATERRLSLLNEAVLSFNTSAASELMQELRDLRQNGTDQQVISTALNDLLSQGPDKSLKIWSAPRYFSRFSRRARMTSLRRTLDLTTPPPPAETEEDEALDTLEEQQRRRRRALVSLLGTLESSAEEAKGVAIRFLEKKARQEKKATQRNEDWTARRPDGLETPSYEVLVRRPSKNFEIRRYDPFSVCSVSMTKPRPEFVELQTDATIAGPKTSGARSFGALAGYLFGKNKQKQSMSMTTPVLTSGQSEGKQMSFVLPSEYWKDGSLDSAPKPLDGSGVTLEQKDGGYRAVIMFGGYASAGDTTKRKKELSGAMAAEDDWEAVDAESVTLSQYNDPFTPPWKRLNEVSISVRPSV